MSQLPKHDNLNRDAADRAAQAVIRGGSRRNDDTNEARKLPTTIGPHREKIQAFFKWGQAPNPFPFASSYQVPHFDPSLLLKTGT